MLALPPHRPQYIIGCDYYGGNGECHITVTKVVNGRLEYENRTINTGRSNP